MLGEFKAVLTGAKLVAVLVIAATLFGGGYLVAWQAPFIGAAAKLSAARADTQAWRDGYRSWKAYGEAEKRAFDESERLRAAERGVAGLAAAESDAQCTARIATARASAAAINRITQKEPSHDPQTGCPIRRLADPGELRQALRPGSSAASR